MTEQTPAQKMAEQRIRRDQERAEAMNMRMMLNVANELALWRGCSFSDCRRMRRCGARQFSPNADVSWKVRMLSETIMPACAAEVWYHGLQDMVLDMLKEYRETLERRGIWQEGC